MNSIVLDGECVVCGEDGIANFARLYGRRVNEDAVLYAFDLLELNGKDYRKEPLEKRKAKLEKVLVKERPGVRYTDHLDSEADLMFEHGCRLGLEGIVSKRRDKPYRSGRCEHWIKVKNPISPALRRLEEEPPREG